MWRKARSPARRHQSDCKQENSVTSLLSPLQTDIAVIAPEMSSATSTSEPASAPKKDPPKPMKEVVDAVKSMSKHGSDAKKLASKHGLDVLNVMTFKFSILLSFDCTTPQVTWEDSARNKNSSWGPCISDMTLNVCGQNMPVIRQPKFADTTGDVALEKIPMKVSLSKSVTH